MYDSMVIILIQCNRYIYIYIVLLYEYPVECCLVLRYSDYAKSNGFASYLMCWCMMLVRLYICIGIIIYICYVLTLFIC